MVSALLDAAKTWSITQTDKKRFDAFGSRCLVRMYNVKQHHYAGNIKFQKFKRKDMTYLLGVSSNFSDCSHGSNWMTGFKLEHLTSLVWSSRKQDKKNIRNILLTQSNGWSRSALFLAVARVHIETERIKSLASCCCSLASANKRYLEFGFGGNLHKQIPVKLASVCKM